MNPQSIVLTLIGAATAVFAGLPYGWAQAAATGLGAFFAAYNVKDIATKTTPTPVVIEYPAAPAAPTAPAPAVPAEMKGVVVHTEPEPEPSPFEGEAS